MGPTKRRRSLWGLLMGFTRILTPDQNLQLIQDNISNSQTTKNTATTITNLGANTQKNTNAQVNNPYQSGRLITVSLTAGQDNLIPHGLGYKPNGFHLANQDTNTTVWNPTTAKLAISNINQSSNSTFINLWCGTTCSISLWIF